MPPTDGMAIGCIMSEPRPLAQKMGSRPKTVLEIVIKVAGLQQEDVAPDDFRRRHHQGMAITDHARPRRYKTRQCCRCAFRPNS